MWPFSKKKGLTYRAFGGANYTVSPSPDNCWVAENGIDVAYFENMWVTKANLLHIDHFAVDSSQRGKGKAEAVLRGFASLVAKQAPSIVGIEFDLGRAATGSNIQGLAAGRVSLFNRIGATSVQQKCPNPNCIVVSAVWYKARW